MVSGLAGVAGTSLWSVASRDFASRKLTTHIDIRVQAESDGRYRN